MNSSVAIALYSFQTTSNATTIPSIVPFGFGAPKKNVGKNSTVPGSRMLQFQKIHVCSINTTHQNQNNCTNGQLFPDQSNRLRTPPPRINTSLGPAPTNTEPSSNASGLAPSLPSTSSSETSPKLMECIVRIEGLEKRLPDFEDRIIRLVMKLDPTSSNPVSRAHSHTSQKCPTISPSLKSAADEPFFSSQGGTDTTTSSSKPSPSSDVPFNWSAFQLSTGDPLNQPSQTTDVNIDDSGLWREFTVETNASVTALNPFSSLWGSSDGERNSFGKEMGQQSDPPPTNLADFAWGDNVMFPGHNLN